MDRLMLRNAFQPIDQLQQILKLGFNYKVNFMKWNGIFFLGYLQKRYILFN